MASFNMALASFFQRTTQHSSGGPDLLLHGKGAICLHFIQLGAGKAIVDPEINDSLLLSQARCWVYPGLDFGVSVMLPLENLTPGDYCKVKCQPFLSCSLLSFHSKLWEIVETARKGWSGEQRPPGRCQDIERKAVLLVIFTRLTYPCSSQNAIGTWFINCLCFSHRPR